MTLRKYILLLLVYVVNLGALISQNFSPAPYCVGLNSTGSCSQPGPPNAPGNGINDFIDCFETFGANSNINNCNSGCNNSPTGTGGNSNFQYFCSHYLQVDPGQTITCVVRSGNTFAQGFAIFVDWNQDNVFNVPGERVAGTPAVPPAATNATLSFVVPTGLPNGVYRMRVRCVFATPGNNINPCNNTTFGETEDYNLFVGAIPNNMGTPTATVSNNSPVCTGQMLSFSIATQYNGPLSYTWTGPATYTSNAQNPSIINPTTTATGIYTVIISNTVCPVTKTVEAKVIPYPNYQVTPLVDTICQGGSYIAAVNFLSGSAPVSSYTFQWLPLGVGILSPNAQSTPITPPLLPVTQSVGTNIYSVVVTPTAASCPITKTLAVVINNPLTPTLTLPGPVCNTTTPITLIGAPPGGTWSAVSAVTSGGTFDPSQASIGITNVTYSVSAGICVVSNHGTLSVSQFNTAALSKTLALTCEYDAPINLMNIVQNTLTGIWSGGPYVSANMFSPSGLATGSYNLTYNTWSTPVSSVCPSSTVLNVSVFNPPVPVISPIRNLCNTFGAFTLAASPVLNGVWGNNSGVSIGGILTPSLCGIGTNTVTYTSGIGTCVATSSANFNVSKFNSAALSGTVPHLCVTSNPFHLSPIVQSPSAGSWWTGINVVTAGGSYSFNPGGLATGLYKLTYHTISSPIAGLCDDSKVIAVSVLNPPVPNITPSGPYCSTGGTVQLNVVPNTGVWTNFSYMSPTGVLTPSLCAIGSNTVQYTIGTSTCNSQQSRVIQVEAFELATIYGHIPEQCNTNQVISLLPMTNGGGTWSGAGILGSNFSPALAGAGHFTLTHQTASKPSGLCPDKDIITVKVFSLAAPAISSQTTLCNNSAPIRLQVSPVGGLFSSGANGLVSFDGLFSPAMAAIGDNVVSYSVSSGPCIAFTQSTIRVEKFLSADFATSQVLSFCQGDEAIDMNLYAQNSGGVWFGNGVTPNGSMFNPALAPTGVLTKITHSIGSASCPHTATINVLVNPSPSVSLTSNLSAIKNTGCAPQSFKFNLKPLDNSPIGKGRWYINDGKELEQEGAELSYTFQTPGIYTVVANYFTQQGCSTQVPLKDPVRILESPKAEFDYEPKEVSIARPEISISNQSSILGNNRYEWTVYGGNQTYEINPIITFPQIGSYRVKLKATSLDGCTSEITKVIEVKNDFNVYIPNSFSPNADGINDTFLPVFSPYGLDAKTYQMQIFNRWGEMVFKTNNPLQGWDGTMNNNSAQTLKQDSYLFKITYKDNNGKLYEKTGNVALWGEQ